MADKINFKMRRITEIEECLVMTTGPPLQNDKVILQVNAAVNSFKICEVKMDITKSRNRQNHIIVGGLLFHAQPLLENEDKRFSYS